MPMNTMTNLIFTMSSDRGFDSDLYISIAMSAMATFEFFAIHKGLTCTELLFCIINSTYCAIRKQFSLLFALPV